MYLNEMRLLKKSQKMNRKDFFTMIKTRVKFLL